MNNPPCELGVASGHIQGGVKADTHLLLEISLETGFPKMSPNNTVVMQWREGDTLAIAIGPVGPKHVMTDIYRSII